MVRIKGEECTEQRENGGYVPARNMKAADSFCRNVNWEETNSLIRKNRGYDVVEDTEGICFEFAWVREEDCKRMCMG